MISSGTSMGGTMYKITPKNTKRSLSEPSAFNDFLKPKITLSPKFTIKNTKIRKNISPIVDLMKQSKLEYKPLFHFDKNYFLNLVKLQIKKNNCFPPIKTLSSIKSIPIIDYNSDKNSHTTPNLFKDKCVKTYSNKYLNRRYNTNSFLYKKGIGFRRGKEENLKSVYVHKILTPTKINSIDYTYSYSHRNDNTNMNDNDKIKIKNKIEENNYNINVSKFKFLMFHGHKKRKENIKKSNSVEKTNANKYKGYDNKKIRQYFLKQKFRAVNTRMMSVQKDVELAKSNLNYLFNYINKEIESKLNEEYKKK